MTDDIHVKEIDAAISCFPPVVLSTIIHNYAKPSPLRFNVDNVFCATKALNRGVTNVLLQSPEAIIRYHLNLTPTYVSVTHYSSPWLFVVSTLTLDQMQDSFSVVVKKPSFSFDFILGCCRLNEPGRCHLMSWSAVNNGDCTLKISKTSDQNAILIQGFKVPILLYIRNAFDDKELNYSNIHFCIGIGYHPQSIKVLE
jgi:hypothetical protein